MSWPGLLHFSHIADYFCPLPDPSIGQSIIVGPIHVMLSIFLSICVVYVQPKACSVRVWYVSR